MIEIVCISNLISKQIVAAVVYVIHWYDMPILGLVQLNFNIGILSFGTYFNLGTQIQSKTVYNGQLSDNITKI